jgi:hypothetical protein
MVVKVDYWIGKKEGKKTPRCLLISGRNCRLEIGVSHLDKYCLLIRPGSDWFGP